MLLSEPSASRSQRASHLALTLAFSATASAAAPPETSSLSALQITLGCLAVCLLSVLAVWAVVSRALRRRPTVPPLPTGEDIVTTARDAILVIQESGEIVSANPAAETLFGYFFSELRGKSISALIPPHVNRRRPNYLYAAGGRELIGIRKTGASFPLDLVLSELSASAGEKQFSLFIRDRSDRSRAEAELESQSRFAFALIDHLPSLLTVIDHDGRIVRFNRTCEELTQFAEGEIRGQSVWQALAAPAEMEQAESQIRRLFDGPFPARSRSQWRLRNHSLRTIAWTHNALRDEYGRVTHIVSAGADITNTLQAEERLRENRSLTAAGRPAGGIAHDFNNLRTAITSYSGLALGSLEQRDSVASPNRRPPAFSGNLPYTARLVNCNDAVRSIERLVRVMAGDAIHVDLSLEAGLPLIVADTQLIEECIMHLVANAREAMAKGGAIQIQTGVRTLNRTRMDARPPLGPGEYVTLSVVDTGAGIPPEALPHIFEPYYTTRTGAASNGMGLAMVYDIVREAQGSIVVHSAPNHGSTFRIFLPLAPNQ